MKPRLKKLAIPLLRWTLGLIVLIESIRELFAPAEIQHFASTGLPQWVRLALASGEIVAAILFIAPFTITIGGCALIVIFVLAVALHLLHGQYDVGALLVYVMAVWVSMAYRSPGMTEAAHDRR
jgi:uncharacterized membrane protein YphA (DoxX/SURF4 family)